MESVVLDPNHDLLVHFFPVSLYLKKLRPKGERDLLEACV